MKRHEWNYGWDGKGIHVNIEPTNDQDAINLLRSENAYLRGKIEAYEKFLKRKGFIEERSANDISQ